MADEALFLLLHNEMVAGLYRAAEQGEGVSGAGVAPEAVRRQPGPRLRRRLPLCLAGERPLHHQAGEHGLPRRAGADREVSEAPACFLPRSPSACVHLLPLQTKLAAPRPHHTSSSRDRLLPSPSFPHSIPTLFTR